MPQSFQNASIDELLSVLLRQFKRPLKPHGIDLSDADATAIAQGIANKNVTSEFEPVHSALIRVIQESEEVLDHWGLGFEKSLDVKMDDMPGWESTAEFLELANEKSNAELRIAAGSALIAAFGDLRYASYLLHLAGGLYGDETDVAQRILEFVSGIDPASKDGLTRIRQWVDSHRA